jgi:hypothetical protein
LEGVDGITDGRNDGLVLGAKVGVADGLDDGIGVEWRKGDTLIGRGLDDTYASLLILHLVRQMDEG